jgi:hypothetical protein
MAPRETREKLTFGSLEFLEHLDEANRSDQVRVLGSRLNDDLKVLSDVDLEHLVETFESLFDGELTEVVDEPL